MQPLWETVWRFIKKPKIELPYETAILLLGIYPEKKQKLIRKDTHIPVFIAALFMIAKIWNLPKCPLTDERVKMWMDYCLAIKKNEIMPFTVTWIDFILSEVIQRKTNIL